MIPRFTLAIALLHWAALIAAAATPPAQPAGGPGGAEYQHRDVVAAAYGQGATRFWLFEPANPRPKTAPVVVFLHGWGGIDPAPYRAWVDHIVKRGHIVIYPVYQANLRTPVQEFAPNAGAAIRDALRLAAGDAARISPDTGRFAMVGHSMGGVLSANLAATAERAGLPKVSAFMSVQPGKTWMRARRAAVTLEDLAQVPSDTLILAVAGDRDRLARDVDARRIYLETTRVPPRNKGLVMVMSDGYGSPPLEAHHFSPLARGGAAAPEMSVGRKPGAVRERLLERRGARGENVPAEPYLYPEDTEDMLPNVGSATATAPDALDFYGYWKLFDGLLDAAFWGRNREYALGSTPRQRHMGVWSDGRPVRELVILDRP